LEGLAHLLRTDLKIGLRKKKANNKWASEVSLMIGDGEDTVPQPPNSSLFNMVKRRGSQGAVNDRLNSILADVRDANIRIDLFGRNYIEPPLPQNILSMLYDSIKTDAILKILLIGALVALIVGLLTDLKNGWVDAFAIFIAVAVVSTVTAVNNYSSEQKFRKLLLMQSAIKVKVVRDEVLDEISSWDLLVGIYFFLTNW
jgi:magnesium-transporting ATPase (P-type)